MVMLKKRNDDVITDVVLGHDAVEHVVGAFGVGHGQLVELDEVFEDERKLGRAVKDGAAVDVAPVALDHRLGARLGREDAVVAVALQLRKEVVVKLFRFHLLKIKKKPLRSI